MRFFEPQNSKEHLLNPDHPQDMPAPAQTFAHTDTPVNHNAADDWVPLSEIEGRYVARVLEHTGGNKQAAARILAVDRKTLDRMIKRHHIETQNVRAHRPPVSGSS